MGGQITKPPQSCGNCIYFRDFICVFYPPKVINKTYFGDGGGSTTVWPEVKEEDWCGKWKEIQ